MKGIQKPKVLGDIIPPKNRWSVFGKTEKRINLFDRPERRRGLRRLIGWIDFGTASRRLPQILKASISLAAILFLLFGSAIAPAIFSGVAGDASVSDAVAATNASSTDPVAERAALQDQLNQLETQINQYEGQISSYEKQGNTLQGEISLLNAQIAKLNLQIKATNLTISELDGQISTTQSQITVTQSDIASKQTAIGGLILGLYEKEQISPIEAFLKNPRISDFWSDMQNISLAEDNLRISVEQITALQNQLSDQVQQLQASKEDASSAAQYAEAQAQEVVGTKSAKSDLLAETKGQESKYQQLLQQTQATAAQIRSRIFELLGGGQLSFEDAYQFAKVAGNATNVDPAFILAILDRESALGQNVGQCSYKTAMSPSNIPIFLSITSELKLDPNTMLVSCPNSDGAYGGAMGPAQFIPSTWELYADGISQVTGNNPPSPWNDSDAFVATALYLRDGMVGCQAIYSNQTSIERCTAAKYYAGSRWRNYLWTYGEAVVDRANGFAQDIQTINS